MPTINPRYALYNDLTERPITTVDDLAFVCFFLFEACLYVSFVCVWKDRECLASTHACCFETPKKTLHQTKKENIHGIVLDGKMGRAVLDRAKDW